MEGPLGGGEACGAAGVDGAAADGPGAAADGSSGSVGRPERRSPPLARRSAALPARP